MNTNVLLQNIKDAFKTNMPNGFISVEKMSLGSGVCIRLGMIEELSDCISKIRLNDQAYTLLFIHDLPDDREMDLESVKIEFDGCSIATIPTEKFYAMGRHKVKTRKIEAEPEKAIKSLKKFFEKYKEAIKEVATENKLYHQDRIPEKYYKF